MTSAEMLLLPEIVESGGHAQPPHLGQHGGGMIRIHRRDWLGNLQCQTVGNHARIAQAGS
mgnify:CR=1 FL=1